MKRQLTEEELQRITAGRAKAHPPSTPSLTSKLPTTFLSESNPPTTSTEGTGLIAKPTPVAAANARIKIEKSVSSSSSSSSSSPPKRFGTASPPPVKEESVTGATYAVGGDEAGKGCVLGPVIVGIVVWCISDFLLLEKL